MKEEKQIWDEADFGYDSCDILMAFSIHINIYMHTHIQKPVSPTYIYIYRYISHTYTYVVLEKTLESPLDCKEIHPVHPK